MSFTEHQGKQLVALKFLPTGYHLGTGCDDNTVKIWDLRKQRCVSTTLAHTKMVSDISFEQTFGSRLMLTSSYDHTCKIWGTKQLCRGQNTCADWILLRTLAGHENKVTSVTHTRDLKYIFTTSFDKTFKVWTQKNTDKER